MELFSVQLLKKQVNHSSYEMLTRLFHNVFNKSEQKWGYGFIFASVIYKI